MPAKARALPFEDFDGSAVRAMSVGAIIRPYPNTSRFDVALTDREPDTTHQVRLAYDGQMETYHGSCDCAGFRYHADACAHLWAVYVGETRGACSTPAIEELADGTPTCPLCGEDHAESQVVP